MSIAINEQHDVVARLDHLSILCSFHHHKPHAHTLVDTVDNRTWRNYYIFYTIYKLCVIRVPTVCKGQSADAMIVCLIVLLHALSSIQLWCKL